MVWKKAKRKSRKRRSKPTRDKKFSERTTAEIWGKRKRALTAVRKYKRDADRYASGIPDAVVKKHKDNHGKFDGWGVWVR